MDDTEFARFMSHVEVGECWLWTAGKGRDGYGHFRLHGNTKRTHRLMLERTIGRALGEGMCALHSCRNRHCCRPEHLREGTRVENAADKVRDGTTARIRGERNGLSNLTEDHVRAIRADPRSQRVIAEEYKVSHAAIGYIKRRETWTHI
jgi:hypothetical protein